MCDPVINFMKQLPNFLTCCNLLCGAIAVIFILEERSLPAAYFVWVACVFDFFDGFAARALKVSSSIGKELDSLADMVSFGVVPGLLMYKMLGDATTSDVIPYAGLLITVFSGLRLAIFNVDETQRENFKGLATPANTIFISSLPLIQTEAGTWLYQTPVLILITVIFSFLLVSRIDIFALKFKNFSWQDNKIRFVFLILSALLLIVFQQIGIPLVIILYVLLSLLDNVAFRKQS